MTILHRILWNMFQRVIKLMDPFVAGITKPAAVIQTYAAFKLSVGEIEKIEGNRGSKKKGKVKAKNALERLLEEKTFIIVSTLYSFGIFHKNYELAASTNVSESDIEYLPQAELYNAANNFYTLAKANPEAMAENDITPEEVEDLKTTAEKYKESIGEVGEGNDDSKKETEKLNKLYSTATHQLEELDTHMKPLKTKVAETFELYEAARLKKLTGIRHEDETPETPPAQ